MCSGAVQKKALPSVCLFNTLHLYKHSFGLESKGALILQTNLEVAHGSVVAVSTLTSVEFYMRPQIDAESVCVCVCVSKTSAGVQERLYCVTNTFRGRQWREASKS